MTLSQAVILGAVQGVTEFLPVSSSGHLAIAQNFFGLKNIPILFDIFLHLGALFAVLFVIDKRIVRMVKNPKNHKPLFINLGIATAVTALFGLLLRNTIVESFASQKVVGVALLVTGLILLTTNQRILVPMIRIIGTKKPAFLKPALIGLAQSLALFPGISRSGSTIAIGLVTGMKPKEAFEFSFLLLIPVTIGAVLLELVKTPLNFSDSIVAPSVFGMLTAFVVGLISLKFLKKILGEEKLWYFSPYCIALGLLVLFL